MRIGFAVPQYGVFADPGLITEVSRDLEDMGYDSLWAGDRVIGPLSPSDPYPSVDGVMPPQYATCFDPLSALTLAALATRRVRLGTSTLNALWQPPIMLARSLTSLDLLSDGRLDVGIGLGWLRDEYTAVGVPWEHRGARLEETLDLMEKLWTSEVVEHDGPRWTVPPSHVGLKPRQKPRPPILLGGFSPGALERVGRRADGWLGAAMPLPYLTALWGMAQAAAEKAGRDPSSLRLVLRANTEVTDRPAGADRAPATGTVPQICEYLRTTADAGADEVFIDPQTTTSSRAELLDTAEAFITELRTP
ncbi:TIGR03619 family F420-dependent LLM class oxidoreductase [Sphaerisporangium sp. TRM90804]|uniref:TIGR03619 family F420-dependent LLM class oxidoreductase n=1 Tax=Sphaerisporangium sp. TRM90804 TaxID=3031113 RepID=UPI00244AA6F3|nr:TIGR03619 family F420-dependent LLM class oxidoreductase [Sphaerisporangium sp. TRM90804]MDH2427029.1 TIGR03619 family F420-dependent LLM class oxidoreductase [Sphaerisporangium sp. TRM90804]